MINEIKAIATRLFRGETRKGPRHEYILQALKKNGCNPQVDKYANIWVEKGSGKNIILLSSHIDVDPHVNNLSFKAYKKGNRKIISGVIDNSIGCYINIILAKKTPKKSRVIYVFTASEEVEKKNHRHFAISAREIVREFRRRKIKPKLCIAIDVTYPKLLVSNKRIGWQRTHEEIFDMKDSMHCYLDGYSNLKSKRIGNYFIKKFKHAKIAIREFYGHDEAHIYSKIAPSFAFGPVVHGRFDKPHQTMPLVHAKTAIRFLKGILSEY